MATILYFLLFCRLLQRNGWHRSWKFARSTSIMRRSETNISKIIFFSLKIIMYLYIVYVTNNLYLERLKTLAVVTKLRLQKGEDTFSLPLAASTIRTSQTLLGSLPTRKAPDYTNITHTIIRLFSLGNESMMWMSKDSFFSISISWSSSWTLRSSSSKWSMNCS